MEPRWFAEEWPREGLTYLGGTNDFDLWIDYTKDVRVVWGNSVSLWDWFHWSRREEAYEWGSQDKNYVNHDEVLGEALTYLSIFAPWVAEVMTTGEQDYHKN